MRLPRPAAVLAFLAVSSPACVGDGPVDPETKLAAFSLLGGLRVGEALALQGDEAERLLLPGREDGTDFVVVPFFGTEGAEASVEVEIAGGELLDVVGPPSGSAEPDAGPLRPDRAPFARNARVHRRIRAAEIRDLEPRVADAGWRGEGSPFLRRLRSAGVPPAAVDDTISLRTIDPNQTDLCADPLDRGGRVTAVTDGVILVSDTASPAELSDAQFQAVATEFDELVEPVLTQNFGAPTDIDQNGRVMVFFTPVINRAEALGLTFTGDLFPRSECAASNEGEIVYLFSPDPDGVTPVQIATEVAAQLATRTIGHEYQHLINAGRRIFVNGAERLEASWLNEGLSHIAEELLFYATTSVGPGENVSLGTLQSSTELVDAANRFVVGNLALYAVYAAAPSEVVFAGPANLSTRGAVWAFLRYAADHEEGDESGFFFDLANSTSSGFDNLDRVLDRADAVELMQAWTASVFSDDEVNGVPAFLTQPSWNYRTILPVFTDGSFPLDVQVVDANGSVRIALRGGGAAFVRVRVDPGRQAEVRVAPAGSNPGALRVSVVRAR